ncbi:MAG: helix-turn-helix transcriptional regulator [Deltaproteobacteria bacterium]|nr:helix-turn-helix transcriptional regulator [Deltaproteobacteria bacterium]
MRADRVLRAVGRRFAELRARRGLTQETLAERIGVSLKYLQRIEAGRENLTLKSLVELANTFRVKVDDLFRRPVSLAVRRGRPRKR